MGNLNALYQLGIQNWNRNNLEESEYYFTKLLKDISLLDEFKKTKISEFFIYINKKDIACEILKNMIMGYENISFSVTNYLKLNQENIEIKEIEDFLQIKVLKNNVEINYLIAEILYRKNEQLKCYELCSNMIDYLEKNNQLFNHNFEIYYKYIMLIVEMEYEFENYVQSRFQLKKMINNAKNINTDINMVNQIIYWVIVLDILNEVLSSKEWIELIKVVDKKELKILIHTLIKMYKNELSLSMHKSLSNYSFTDEKLKDKAHVISIYVNKCIGNNSWKIEIEKVDLKKHYIAMLMYHEKMQFDNNFNQNEFFNEYFQYHSDRHQIVNAFWNIKEKKINKNLDNIKIKFIGGADKIGGSCILIQHKNTKILLDSGGNINGECIPDFSVLEEENITIDDIDYLIISHGHFDHIGSLPYIYKQNNNIKILATSETKDIMKVMLEEINRGNIHEKKIFDAQDIKNAVSSVEVKQKNKTIKLNDEINLKLFNAGHILGATAIYLEIEGVGVLYTGDCCVHNQYTVKGMELPKDIDVDILITESTYAYHPNNFNLNKERQEKIFLNDITSTVEKNGVVLIPAFALGRAQEIVMTIKEYFKNDLFLPFNVYLDGKVVEVCEIYEKYMINNELYSNGVSNANSKNNVSDEYLLEKYRGSCIIASSGMLNENSKSSKYANAIINDSKSLILFSGYLDEESPGNQILKKINEDIIPTINISGNTKEVTCNVKSYKLSAHIKKYELLKLILNLKPKYTFLIHGDTNNRYKYLGDEKIGEDIYPCLETLMYYIDDNDIITPANGDLYKFN